MNRFGFQVAHSVAAEGVARSATEGKAMIYQDRPSDGYTIDATATMYPTMLTVIRSERTLGSRTDTCYGYIVKGRFRLKSEAFSEVELSSGNYFVLVGPVSLFATTPSDASQAVVITRYGFRSLAALGMLEGKGRLSYIDGCSTSIIGYPPRLGDPVYNHLHFPQRVLQSQHTHPSIRLGIVARGHGLAWQGHGELKVPSVTHEHVAWMQELNDGGVFLLEEQELHSFCTERTSMDIVAYHPDSDWGPTDEAHPMLNRTYLNR
jgi:hypothetical protein